MEQNNQPQPPVNSSVSTTPTPTPIVSPIPDFDLSTLVTPPKTDALEQVFVPPPPIGIPVITAIPVVPQIPLAQQVEQLEKDIVLLDQKRASLEVETGALASEQKQIEDSLAPILKEEQEQRAAFKEIEAREMSAKTKEDRRKAEQERWEGEQKRRAVEVERLLIRERIEKVLSTMKGKETLHQSIIDEESSIKKKIHELETEQKRIELNVKLELITRSRGDAELQLADIVKEKTHIEALLHETEVKEKTIEGSEHDTEQKMTAAKTFKEEHALAEARAQLEKERHEIEEARWRAEDQADALGLSVEDAEKSLEDIKKQEAELIAKLKAFK
jgi:hypothetical protein